MKRILHLVILCLCLTGCSRENQYLDRALSLRQKLLNGAGCQFKAEITADYGQELYSFVMDCKTDQNGAVRFCVIEPESISNITGVIEQGNGKLTFDDKAIAFSMLADGQLSPISAPWVMMQALRSGYIDCCGRWEKGVELMVDDSYEEDALHLDIKLNESDCPVYAEILWDERRVLSVKVNDFIFL